MISSGVAESVAAAIALRSDASKARRRTEKKSSKKKQLAAIRRMAAAPSALDDLE